MDEKEIHDCIYHYYRKPNPSLALVALRQFALSQSARDPTARLPVQYFFGRLLEIHPELRDQIANARSEIPPDQPPVIDEILAVTERPKGIQNAIDRTDIHPQINDLLWAEHNLTGDPRAVERLIDIMNQPDLVRNKIQRWLRSGSVMQLVRQPIQNWKCKRLRFELGIVCNLASKCVTTLGDLDCQCLLDGWNLDNNRLKRMQAIIPLRLTNEDLLYIVSKATAKWSLASRAPADAEVREICEQQIGRHALRTNLSLLEIAIKAHASHKRHEAVADLATQYLSMNADHTGMQTLLAETKSRIELDILLSLSIPEDRGALSDFAETAKRCIDVTEMAFSYRTRFVARSLDDLGHELRMEWNMEYYDPGRFHVTQEAQPGDEYDEWIAIGDDVWCQPFWFHRSGTELTTNEHGRNTMLGVEPYLELLARKAATDGFTVEVDGRSFAVLVFNVDANEEQAPLLSRDEAMRYWIWIDRSSGLILKIDIQAQGADGSTSLCHVFSSYDEEISIDPPSHSADLITGKSGCSEHDAPTAGYYEV